jgi:hypothetical protein
MNGHNGVTLTSNRTGRRRITKFRILAYCVRAKALRCCPLGIFPLSGHTLFSVDFTRVYN